MEESQEIEKPKRGRPRQAVVETALAIPEPSEPEPTEPAAPVKLKTNT